jgi:hypothetical protein
VIVDKKRRLQLVRQFPENGLKVVLSTPANLRELLVVAQASMLERLDFRQLTVEPTTYVTAEYRHATSDLVLTLPMTPTRRGRRKKRLTVTVLLELQSQPERLMMLRVLEYLVLVWKHQAKKHGEKHGSLASVKLRPVLPVVLHTGSYSWEKVGKLIDLMDDAADFAPVTPEFTPLFVSLPDRPESELEGIGAFGQVMSLMKVRKARRAVFAERLVQTVSRLEDLPGEEQLRRGELLSYVETLVYHAREEAEHPALRERIDAALRHNADRLEVEMTRRTLADVHRNEGRLEGTVLGMQRVLLELLRSRWGPLPAETERAIETTQDPDQLTEWARRVLSAQDLEGIGILRPR